MKFGVRTPSIKKSVKARTTGKINRAVKKSVDPLYGKSGMGLVNDPKKSVYNKVYKQTTVGVNEVIDDTSSMKKAEPSNDIKIITEPTEPTKPVNDGNKKDLAFATNLLKPDETIIASTFGNFKKEAWSLLVLQNRLLVVTARWKNSKKHFEIPFDNITSIDVEKHLLLSKLHISTESQTISFTSMAGVSAESIKKCIEEAE